MSKILKSISEYKKTPESLETRFRSAVRSRFDSTSSKFEDAEKLINALAERLGDIAYGYAGAASITVGDLVFKAFDYGSQLGISAEVERTSDFKKSLGRYVWGLIDQAESLLRQNKEFAKSRDTKEQLLIEIAKGEKKLKLITNCLEWDHSEDERCSLCYDSYEEIKM